MWDVDAWDGDFLVVVRAYDGAAPRFVNVVADGLVLLEGEMVKHGL